MWWKIVETIARPDSIPALISVVIAFFALLVGRRTAHIERSGVLAGLFQDFSNRYNGRDMREAMLALGAAYLAAPKDKPFAEAWYAGFSAGDENARSLDNQRRLINRYFSDIVRLYHYGYVDKRFVRMTAKHYAINVYYRVVHPMNQLMFRGELEINEFEDDFSRLKSLIRQFGNGLLTGENKLRRL